ncbi:H(+)/Cl(-) exchange transporter 5 [Smittium culicis]|uniref:H(+)/Cl(-) exchange transporter 5 n=1 Tax=Smittium culicis TaxID=133412 RepID=A0A1R1XPG2_9FUNG|nr:H(+)/Cl(-) exchange transporter 5 [Smittium culicis]
MYILGYLSSNDLRLGLEMASINRNEFSPNTKCFFGYTTDPDNDSSQTDLYNDRAATSSSSASNAIYSNSRSAIGSYFPDTGPEFFDYDDNESVYVDLRPYMDHSPITVFPDSPIDLVIDIFRQLGIRYVLVAKNRVLYGIITKKDVLKCANEMDVSFTSSILHYLFPSIW